MRIGLPSSLCRKVGLSLPETNDREALHDMALAQLEQRGLTPQQQIIPIIPLIPKIPFALEGGERL